MSSLQPTPRPVRNWGRVGIVVVLAMVAPATRAADVALSPSADTFVYAGEPIYNYGGAGTVTVSGASTREGEFQALLKFDTAAARDSFDAAFGAGGWRLGGAFLRLATSNPNNPLFNPNTAGSFPASWMQNDGWTEGTGSPIAPASDGVTFATLPSFLSPSDESAGTIDFPGGTSGANTYALSPSPGFAADVLGGDALSLRLFAGPESSASYVFSSRTFNVVANRPVLTLSAVAVPEPAGAGMILGVSVALLMRRRSRASVAR